MRTEYEVWFKFSDPGTFKKYPDTLPTLDAARARTPYDSPDDWQTYPDGNMGLAQHHLDAMGRDTPWLIKTVQVSDADHLNVNTTDRGFDHHAPVPSEYGGEVRVSESSAAMGPHVWLRATAPVNLNEPAGPTHEAPIHLTAENAWLLARQLAWLVANHYQGDARPDAYWEVARTAMATAFLQTQRTGPVSSLADASSEEDAEWCLREADALLEPLHRLGFAVVRIGPEDGAVR